MEFETRISKEGAERRMVAREAQFFGQQEEWSLQDVDKLQLLVDRIRSQDPTRIRGSPFSVILDHLSDQMNNLAGLLFSNTIRGQKLTPGIKFETEEYLPDEFREVSKWGQGTEVDNTTVPRSRTRLGEPSQEYIDSLMGESDNYEPQVYFDPVFRSDYIYKSSLGNPLQVSIDFGNTEFHISREDRITLGHFFQDLDQVLRSLSSGLIDWRFIKHLRRYYRDPRSGDRPTSKEQQKHYKKRQFYKRKEGNKFPSKRRGSQDGNN